MTLRPLMLAFFAALVTASGCATKKPANEILVSFPVPAPGAQGKSSYTYVFDPANPALHLDDDVQFVRPVPVETKSLPIYPERALAARDGTHREVVRIIIDEQGNVAQVQDSPLRTSDGGPFAEDYRHAVEAAVRSWRYRPGMFWHFTAGPDNDGDGKPDYKTLASDEKIAVYYDIRFTFEILEGVGVVKETP